MNLNIWLILGGIGIFLFGIQMLENALKNLMSRSFKLFLKKQTGNTFKAIFGGAAVTAILQSSSAVNFMVLAFVSNGVITMRNAFAVIMGTNLGTTLDSWIVASLGFKVDIEAYAYPVAGIAGLILFIFPERQKLADICHFFLGFSFLFIGLGLMKESMEGEAIRSLFQNFEGSSLFVFLLLGFVATTITQSSSATIAITLSILHLQLIGFESAIAVVIGSEVGTSLKLILGSLNGIAVKKRVATGNFIYNLITTILAFIFLHPLAVFITENLSVRDPLMGLVAFQTGMNVFSILIFLPFLNIFTKFLEGLFTGGDKSNSGYIKNTNPTVPHAALELMYLETHYFLNQCKLFNAFLLELPEDAIKQPLTFSELNTRNKSEEGSFAERYENIKDQYGEIQNFYFKLGEHKLNEKEINSSDILIASVRSAMYSSKCIKDLHADIMELKNDAEESKFHFFKIKQQEVLDFYQRLDPEILRSDNNETVFELLIEFLQLVSESYVHNQKKLYSAEYMHVLSDVEVATLMNFNRELFTSNKSLIMAHRFFISDVQLLQKLEEIPTYQA